MRRTTPSEGIETRSDNRLRPSRRPNWYPARHSSGIGPPKNRPLLCRSPPATLRDAGIGVNMPKANYRRIEAFISRVPPGNLTSAPKTCSCSCNSAKEWMTPHGCTISANTITRLGWVTPSRTTSWRKLFAGSKSSPTYLLPTAAAWSAAPLKSATPFQQAAITNLLHRGRDQGFL